MTFEEAQDRVKIGHFTRKGGKIRGVVHVGTNDGEEIPYYIDLGAKRVLGFEPNLEAWERCVNRWNSSEITVLPFGLGDTNRISRLLITEGDGKGSSFCIEKDSPYRIVAQRDCPVVTFASLGIDLFLYYNTLVIDVQGMEMQVLQGFREDLRLFEFLNIECSQNPLFYGESSAQEIIDYLGKFGFRQDSPIESHDDIMFIREGAL
jgi:FkbM family methyltransferase